MSDNTVTTSDPTGGGTAGATMIAASDDVVVDKNKSAEQYMKEAEAKYIIPVLVREKFPDLIKLIYETESMNKEEREYWLQIMPIMTEEQIKKFRDILVNEKEQLAKLDNEYEQEMSKINQKHAQQIDEKEMKAKIEKIEKAEMSSESEEQRKEEELLKKLEDI